MKLWTRAPDQELLGRIEALEKHVGTLADTLDTLKTLPGRLELEWNDTLDKINRLMGRIAKRARIDETESHEDAPGHEISGSPRGEGHHGILQRMRARRAGVLR